MSSYTGPALLALKLTNPRLFTGIVIHAYAETRSIPKAAIRLGISERTLHRWLDRFPEIKKMGQKGRPRDVNGMAKRERQDKK